MGDRMTTTGDRDRSLLQTVATIVGATFVLVGILGFIPGITTEAPGKFAGDDSEAELLGIFQVSIFHNLFHLAFGLVGFAMARSADGARTYLIGGGVIYLALWLYGLLGGSDEDSSANILGLNSASDWLHFVLGVTMLAIGFLLSRRVTADRTATI